ncbi:MAG TPA: AAA family ATPase, partial [Rhodocyclaceae bacterium]|nr:AAA family ATPase [Rhodocyclaceae bacterium]
MSLARRKLQIGIQTFAKMREGGYYYVDKTPMAWALAQEAGYFFLSRPRRFGKSLFLDTLAELFEGNEGLFTGLFVHDRWDWSERHPVL